MFCLRILIACLILATARPALADTSWFFKLIVFRFAKEEVVKPASGVLDLKDLGTDGYFHVQGEVYFFSGLLLPPDYLDEAGFERLVAQHKPVLLALNLQSALKSHGGIGSYGTFILRCRNQKARDLSIQFPRFYHPTDVYVAQNQGSTRILRADTIDPDPERNRNINPFISSIPLIPVSGDFLIYARVSAPLQDGRSTINLANFYLADEHVISRLMYYNRFASAFVLGAFFMIFIFYSFIYIFRLRDLSSLYLSLFAFFCISLCSFYVIEYDWNPSEVVDRFIILNAFAIGFLQLYLFEKLRRWISARTYRYGTILTMILPVFVFVLMFGRAWGPMGVVFVFSLALSVFLVFATIVLGYRHGMNGLGYFVFGVVCNMAFQVPILFKFIEGDNSEAGYIILLANFFMGIGLALVNAKEYAVTYRTSMKQGRDLEQKNREITFFNRNLEKLVASKTQEIRSLLDHIPQGVLSIGKDGLVSKDYSAHLATVLGTPHIAQRSFKELILDVSTLSLDTRDQIWQSIQASIGETVLNFELNSAKFPLEFPVLIKGQQKFLQATWNVQVENEIVQQILVTLLDVTLEKSLERESSRSRTELRLIEELINVTPNKAAQFFLTSTPLLEENQSLIARFDPQTAQGIIRTLFVNAHTIKGAARTLQFKDLAAVVHEIEDYYNAVMREGVPLDTERLRTDIERALAVLQSYRDVNRIKLGRDDDFSKVAIERSFIEKHFYLLKDILQDDRVDLKTFVSAFKDHSETLKKTIFEYLPAIFDVYKDKAAKIATDVGKTPPRFAFDILPIWIPPATRTVLDYSMVHILRNSMDHGIELVDDRQKAGKDPAGLITIRTKQADARLLITIEDDGRGLAIDRLRERGIRQGMLREGSSLEEIAALIFASGVTTKDQASMLSGRGMGMDAVRSFLEKVDAKVQVLLGDAIPGEHEFRRFRLEISLPLT